MKSVHAELPYIDEHAIKIVAPRDVVWDAVQRYATTSLRIGERSPLAWILRPQPRAGFEVSDAVPGQRLALTGTHRFARYRLEFDLSSAEGGGTQLRAQTYAAFSDGFGRVYRALVIGSRGHVIAVIRMLRAIRRLSVDPASATNASAS